MQERNSIKLIKHSPKMAQAKRDKTTPKVMRLLQYLVLKP